MSDGDIRLGLVGAGYWATSAHAPSISADDGARWQAVAAARVENARTLAAKIGAPDVHGSALELCRSDAVDAVVVTSPATTHAEIVLAAIEHGKHVLCEAPLALSGDEAQRLLDAATAKGVVHAYVRPRPFLYGGERLVQLLAEGAIGEPKSALFSWRGNPWLALPPAASWRTRADAGPPVLAGVTMGVLGATLGPLARVTGEMRRHGPVPEDGPEAAPDYIAGTARTRSGIDVAFQAGGSALELPGSGLTIHGTGGTLVWDWAPPPSLRIARGGAADWETVDYPLEPRLERAWPFTRNLVRAIRSGEPAAPDFAVGVAELRAVDALLASHEHEGRPVEIP